MNFIPAKPTDPDFVSVSNGGCWFCCRLHGVDTFDRKFDTYLHYDCLVHELENVSVECLSEGWIMAYLLKPEDAERLSEKIEANKKWFYDWHNGLWDGEL